MKKFTFEHVSRPSQHTQEWCTLRFIGDKVNGSIELLSRDKVRATKPVWDAIGTYHLMSGKRTVWLNEKSFATRLAATCMTRFWNALVFFGADSFHDDDTFDAVAILPVTGRATNPNTIRNGGTQVRRTSLNLGLKPATGKRHGNYAGGDIPKLTGVR